MKFSQNNEEEVILNYFNGSKGALLSIGENNGMDFSNALALINLGWSALLVEPSDRVFPKLRKLHANNPNVQCLNVAIGDHDGEVVFHDSGGLLIPGTNALLSTCKERELERWGGHEVFTATTCEMISFATMMEQSIEKKFRFISIDAEGLDLEILRQIYLDEIGCDCICIEHNSVPNILSQMQNYILPFGFRQIGFNQENLIMAR